MEGARPRFYDPTTPIPGINPPSAGNYLGCDKVINAGDFMRGVSRPKPVLCKDCAGLCHPHSLTDGLCPVCRADRAKRAYRAKGGA